MQTRSFIHIVLSLLLLISQQMGFAHAASHLGNAAQGGTQAHSALNGEADDASQAALEKVCDQCLVFGQIATALPFDLYSPPLVLPAGFIASHLVVSCIHVPTLFGYQSRAPPAIA